MLEFFEIYGADITAIATAAMSLIGCLYSIIKVAKAGKKIDASVAETKSDVAITQAGIVEAFKSAKIPSDVKVSLSNQVNTSLSKWRDELITYFKEHVALQDQVLVIILKILSYTAASNKLSAEDKATIDELTKLITEKDATIDITE